MYNGLPPSRLFCPSTHNIGIGVLVLVGIGIANININPCACLFVCAVHQSAARFRRCELRIPLHFFTCISTRALSFSHNLNFDLAFLYMIFVYFDFDFEAFVHESNILTFPPPTCIPALATLTLTLLLQ